MISLDEILMGRAKLEELPADVQANLKELLEKMNKVRAAYGKPMKVTSGLRTKEDHIRIYKQAAARKGIAFDESKIPWGSQHLRGAAVDIFDPNKELQAWCTANEALLKQIGLWMESFSATPNWCHFQIKKYGSYVDGKSIWFKP